MHKWRTTTLIFILIRVLFSCVLAVCRPLSMVRVRVCQHSRDLMAAQWRKSDCLFAKLWQCLSAQADLGHTQNNTVTTRLRKSSLFYLKKKTHTHIHILCVKATKIVMTLKCLDLKSSISFIKRVKAAQWGKVKVCIGCLFVLTCEGVGSEMPHDCSASETSRQQNSTTVAHTKLTKRLPIRKSTTGQRALAFLWTLGEPARRYVPWNGRKKSWELPLVTTAYLHVGTSQTGKWEWQTHKSKAMGHVSE